MTVLTDGRELSGPLAGLKIIELAGLGPAPFACMLLADLGVDVVRVDRVPPATTGLNRHPELDLLRRGRRSVSIDLKEDRGRQIILGLVRTAVGSPGTELEFAL